MHRIGFCLVLAMFTAISAAQTPAASQAAQPQAAASAAPAGQTKQVLLCGYSLSSLNTVAGGVYSDGSYLDLVLSCHHPVPKGGTIQKLYSEGWTLKEIVSLTGANSDHMRDRVLFVFER